MKNMKMIVALLIVLFLIVASGSFLYTISETQQVVITQFGEFKRVVNSADSDKNDAGLHFKIPILEQVNYYEKRILEWDGRAEKVPTLDKQFILMDEPTSSLDRRTDERIQQLLSTVLADKTVITIAHRLESLEHFDLILELSEGRLLRQGKPEELIPMLRNDYSNVIGSG